MSTRFLTKKQLTASARRLMWLPDSAPCHLACHGVRPSNNSRGDRTLQLPPYHQRSGTPQRLPERIGSTWSWRKAKLGLESDRKTRIGPMLGRYQSFRSNGDR